VAEEALGRFEAASAQEVRAGGFHGILPEAQGHGHVALLQQLLELAD
jgi:hypothetical protein